MKIIIILLIQKSFEQINIKKKIVGEKGDMLTENLRYQ